MATFKFSKVALKNLEDLAKAAGASYMALVSGLETYNTELEEAKEKLEGLVDAYNSDRDALHTALESERDQFQADFDEKSERWQEGDKGTEVESFISEIDEKLTAMEDEVSVEYPDDVGIELDNPETLIDEMPKEPS